MRQSQKAWVWRSSPALTTGSLMEACALAKRLEGETEPQVIKGISRNLLPRT